MPTDPTPTQKMREAKEAYELKCYQIERACVNCFLNLSERSAELHNAEREYRWAIERI